MTVGATQAAQITLVPTGQPSTLFSTARSDCGRDFIPDAPARAFVRADGKVAMFATSNNNWYLVGRSLLSVKTTCQTALRSSERSSDDIGQLWIEATYTLDGKNVVALTSQDLQDRVERTGCDPKSGIGHCWLNDISAAYSTDMGQTFVPYTGGAVVASITSHYNASFNGRVGYFTTSNIAEHAGYYFVMAYAQADRLIPSGNRLFRTRSVMDPTSWRGWNGSDFTTAPPMRESVVVGAKSLRHEVRSLLYIARYSTWITVFPDRRRLPGDEAPTPGIYMARSSDLVHWDTPSRIVALPTSPSDGKNEIVIYPSILDPHSHSRNFDTIDSDAPILTYTVRYLGRPDNAYNRELKYVFLKLTEVP